MKPTLRPLFTALLAIAIVIFSCQKLDIQKIMVVKTKTVADITGTTANVKGEIVDLGEGMTDYGVYYSTNPGAKSGTKVSAGIPNGTGEYTLPLKNLSIVTKYYVCAYGAKGNTFVYGDETSFTTHGLPTILTTTVSNISATSATCGGNVTSDGGETVTARGVCWSTSQNPTVGLTTKTADGSGTGTFTSSITGLIANTTYYLRAYATNSVGTSYGSEVNIKSKDGVVTLTTATVTGITATSANSGGSISADGGAIITARGVCWSTSQNPTIELTTKTTNGNGSGSFTSNIMSLTPSATYYIRAYATNSVGTSYGNEVTFTTNNGLPVLTTAAATSITATSATGGGSISFDGGFAITARGVCWSTSQNPTIDLPTKTTNGTGAGSFISNLTNLSPGVTYHVRSFATNSLGTSYGEDLPFTTLATGATVTTTVATAMGTTSAISGGNITADGGASVTARGVCWSTVANPTIDLTTKTTDGTGTGTFTSSITGLSSGTTYHVRAYATNSFTTTYGADLTFTTHNLPNLTTTSITAMTANSAASGGSITSDGGAAISARGVCWSTSPGPTTALATKTTDGTGTGAFTSSLTGLLPGTKYYIRAYATTSNGTAYGDDLSFTTLDEGIGIGKWYAGGIVFYIDGTGQHGLVCANSDQGYFLWGCEGTSISGADGTAVGTGNQNTIDIVNGCSNPGIAARICFDLVLNSHSDWFLPSRDELKLMYTNLKTSGIGGFEDTSYWSSSEANEEDAWYRDFTYGDYGMIWKDYIRRSVRAVRSF